MRRRATALLLIASLLGHIGFCESWFLYGDISWNKDQLNPLQVHFEVHTSWDRSGLPLALARVTAEEDITTFNAQWGAAVASGPGSMLNVSIGAKDYVRRRIGFGDGTEFNPGSSVFSFVITRVDPAVVHAVLTFTHTYPGPGAYEAFFEGCCRSDGLLNNAGQSFHLRSTVRPLGSSVEAPRMAMPAVVDVAYPAENARTTLQLGAYSAFSDAPQNILYRLADSEEMGGAMDSNLEAPWNQTTYSSPPGVELSASGLLSVSRALDCAVGSNCLVHVTVILSALDSLAGANVTATTDFMIRIIHEAGPAAELNGLLVTPGSSPGAPVTIGCGSADFFPPASSTYSVSACIDLAEMGSFACSGYTGVCPALAYAGVAPFDQPQYSSCFAGPGCGAGLRRLYCTDLAAQGRPSPFLRLAFAPAPGQAISGVRLASDLPAGMHALPGCDGLGSCAGAPGPAGARFLDLTWQPPCEAPELLRVFALCLTAVDDTPARKASPPSCVYLQARNGSALLPSLALLQPRPPLDLSVNVPTPTQPRANEWRLVLVRQPAHAVAEEAFIVQPQVAILDASNRVVPVSEHLAFSVELSRDAYTGGSVLGGSLRADAVAGIGAFSDLRLSHEGVGFALRIRATGLSVDLAVTTPRFTVLPPVAFLEVGTEPASPTVAGEPIQGPPTVFLFDSELDYVALSSQVVSVSVDGGAAELEGLTQVAAYQGVAGFAGLRVRSAGTFRLRFAIPRHSVASAQFTIVAGHPTYLFVIQQPCAEPCPFKERTQQVSKDVFRTWVQLVDSFYNPSTASANVTASLVRFASFSQRTNLLSGDMEVPVTDGVGRFTDLTVEEQGFYAVKFTVQYGVLTIQNTSVVFDVQLPVDALRLQVQPSQSVAGQVVAGPPTIVLLDAYEFVTESQRPVAARLDAANATFLCAASCTQPAACVAQPNTTCVSPDAIAQGEFTTAVGGVAVLDQVVILRAGTGYRIQATASAAASILTGAFDVVHGVAAGLVVPRLPYEAVLGEPFGVQPIVALVDAWGNLAASVSAGTVAAALDAGPDHRFFLTGFSELAVESGQTVFDNLGVESRVSEPAALDCNASSHPLYASTPTTFSLIFTYSGLGLNLQVQTAPFDVAPGLGALELAEEVGATVMAGTVLSGAVVSLSTACNATLGNSSRAVSVWLDDSSCPERYPEPLPIAPRVTQAELRGLLPLTPNEAFVLTNFKTVGLTAAPNGTAAEVKLIDGRHPCNATVGVSVGGGESQALTCGADGGCVAAGGALYVSVTLVQVPPSGAVRVCARVGAGGFFAVPVLLQQQATLQLHTLVPVTLRLHAPRLALNRPQPLDQTTLWYAGPDVDSCAGWADSESDPRVAVVLSQAARWDRTLAYECPLHPRTGQRYRWASSQEVQDLATIFDGQGSASLLYTTACGSGGLEVGKRKVAFSDSGSRRAHAVLGQAETQAMLLNTPGPLEVGALVCILDEPHLACSDRCPDVPCPPSQAPPAVLGVTEEQGLVLGARFPADNLTSPDLQAALIPADFGNALVLVAGRLFLLLSLTTEPASWVRVRPSPSPLPDVVRWDSSTEVVFGSQLWDLSGAGAAAYDSVVEVEIECAEPRCEAWPLNASIPISFRLQSTVPVYDGKEYTVWLRRPPVDVEEAAALLRQETDAVLGVPPTTQPAVTPVPTPPPFFGDFCIRAASYWPLGGDLPTVATQGPIVWCGLRVKEIDAGAYHSCAVVDAGDAPPSDRGLVVCWGRNQTLQTAVPAELEVSLSGEEVLAAGTYHTCAVTRAGPIRCWGDVTRTGLLSPPTGVAAWKSVSCGTVHSCGVAVDGRGLCWGSNENLQSSAPVGVAAWRSISAGGFHSCGVDAAGGGHCWGASQFDYGQTTLPVSGPWLKISAGNMHSCGILANGTALCWGWSDGGRTAVPPLGANGYWQDISAGREHTCGVSSDGMARCWGLSTESRLVVKPSASGPWAAVSAGYEHSCGILDTGRIACWGKALFGRLALSAAPPVTITPSQVQYDRFGVPLPGTLVSVQTSAVDVSLSVSTPQGVDIFYSVTQGGTTLRARAKLVGDGPRLDVTGSVEAQAVSRDPQLADGDALTQPYQLLVALPDFNPPGVSAGADYETHVEVAIAADADMNPYSSTDVYFSIDGTTPTISSPLYTGPFIVGNETGNATGHTVVKAMAVRDGAVDSDVVTEVYLTLAGTPVFLNGSNLTSGGPGLAIALLSDGTGAILAIQSPTPDAAVYYSLCPPSECSQPTDPTADANSTRYLGPILVNESGTVVRAVAAKPGLALSRVAEAAFRLQLRPPTVFPPPNTAGYLSPLTFNMTCSAGSYGKYSDDGSYPTTVYTGPVLLYRSSPVRALCARALMDDSEEVAVDYVVTPIEILEASLTESSEVVSAPNRLTLTLTTTRQMTVGTRLRLSGLLGAGTPDSTSFPVDNPRLAAAWTQASGTLEAEVLQALPANDRLFAVTSDLLCAEELPFGPSAPAPPSPFLSTAELAVMHRGWRQEVSVNGAAVLRIVYKFQERCTLRQRLTARPADACRRVRWTVVDLRGGGAGVARNISGAYSFSDGAELEASLQRGAGSGLAGLATDDGAWGAVEGSGEWRANGPRPDGFWGQGVFDDRDSNPGHCGTVYFGSPEDTLTGAVMSQLFLTDVDATFVLSFTLINPAQAQAPVAAQVVLDGTWTDAVGPHPKVVGPANVSGAVLGAPVTFGLDTGLSSMTQSSVEAGADNLLSFDLRTNLPAPPGSKFVVSQLTGTVASSGSVVRIGSETVPEMLTATFECVGFRSCSATVADYLPAGASLASATLSIAVACSDFNAPDETIRTVTVDGQPVPFEQGPWAGCEGACARRELVLSSLDVTAASGGAVQVYVAASPGVDAYSCSDSSTVLLDARVSVTVAYYYGGQLVGGDVHVPLQSINTEPACRDSKAAWTDSAGYDCSDYATYGWCSASSCGQAGWACATFANVADGLDASEVCCACGAGTSYWTRFTFQIANPPPGAPTGKPRVALVASGGLVLVNATIKDAVGAVDSPPTARRRRLLSAEAWGSPEHSGRHLLSAHAPWVEAELAVGWAPEKAGAYTCCWAQMEWLLARALADTVAVNVSQVRVHLLGTASTSLTANVSIDVYSEQQAVGVANSLIGHLVARALRLHKVDATVAVSAVQAFDAQENALEQVRVLQVGDDQIGDWYEANMAGLPASTLVAVERRWDIGRLLLDDTLELAVDGVAAFANTLVHRACDSYRLLFAAVLPDYVTYRFSRPFVVTNGFPQKLFVSPIPSLRTDDPYWPCWSPELCSGTRVVAGLPFAVTATVVDEYNNTCIDQTGPVRAMTVNGTGDVYGYESTEVVEGSGILYLAIDVAGASYQIEFTFANGIVPPVRSDIFRVIHAPLARLRVTDEALSRPVVAGEVVAEPFPVVELEDALGNAVREPLEVQASLLSAPARLLGTATLQAAEARVTFADLSILQVGTYTLIWSSSGVQAASRSFEVVHAPVSLGGSLRFERLPGNGVAAEELTVQPLLALYDRFGNLAVAQPATVTAAAAGLSGTLAVPLVAGMASFTDLIVASPGPASLSFAAGLAAVNDTSASFVVGKPLAQLRVVQEPEETLAGDCIEPYVRLALEDEDGQPVDYSRRTVGVDLSVNTFLRTQAFTCGSGGCSATTTFRFFLPADATLVEAFVDVEVAKTDFDEPEEIVEYVLFNGVPWEGGACNPDEANECFNMHTCVGREDVTSLAQDNYFSVTVKISAAVNDFCSPRLQAVARLYGSYRPLVPETETAVQDQNSRGLEGVTSLVATGRTLAFKQLAIPVAGFGYRLRFFSEDPAPARRLLAGHVVETETSPINVLAVAETLEVETQPAEAIAGEPFGVQPRVRLLDKFGNVVGSFEGAVTASIGEARDWDPARNNGAGGWVDKTVSLTGLLVQNVDSGAVKFKNLTVDQYVNRMTLKFSACTPADTGCTLIAFSAFLQVSTAVSELAVAAGFLESGIAAGAQEAEVELRACSSPGVGCRLALTSQARVAVELAPGSPGTELGGVTVVAAGQGRAVFDNLRLTQAATYQLRFFALDLGASVLPALRTVAVVAASPAGIRIVNPATEQTAGQVFEVVVQVVDEFGNDNTEAGMSVVAQPAPGAAGFVLFDGVSNAENWVVRRLSMGNATLQLRVDVAQAADISFTVALAPAESCGAAWTPCNHPQGTDYCFQSFDVVRPDSCLDYALCALFDGECRAICAACPDNRRPDPCGACTVTAVQTFTVQANSNVGELRITFKEQPSGAINGEVMASQPVVFVESCQDSGQCNPTPGVTVSVRIKSAQDQFTAIGEPFRTALGGSFSRTSDNNGDVIWLDLFVAAPTDGATNITLEFYTPSGSFAPILASGFNVIGQTNQLPTIDPPSPLLCTPGEDFETPSTLYVHVGSRLELVVRASDNNTAPYDELSIDFTLSPPGLPPGAYFTEDVYDADNSEERARLAACGARATYNYTLMNRVTRRFVWAPISFYPAVLLSYRAVEAQRSGAFGGVAAGASCTRLLELRVCDRPRFVAPSPLGASGTRMVLAMTDLVFTVAAVDRNAADVVEIDVTERPAVTASGEGELVVGPEVHPGELQVSGLSETRRNKVQREVRWKVPAGPPGSAHTMCFAARDDQFPCEAGGMLSEEELCLVCTLDALAIHATCVPVLRSTALNSRQHVPVCGDARMTGAEEECDDGNALSGDGCSSTCRLEVGYRLNATGPLPANICGDGLAVSNSRFTETCDDGGAEDGDGCSARCEVEEGWGCLECGEQWACEPRCGDSLLRGSESCDDGNGAVGDGCSADCQLEEGWSCSDASCLSVAPVCGDNITVGNEECDGGEGCNADCTIIAGFDCSGGVCNTTCGDGDRVGREECDDGNSQPGDGCDQFCRVESRFGCVARPPLPAGFVSGTIRPQGYIGEAGLDDSQFVCDEICGDGYVAGVHGCDDANNDDGDGCSAACSVEEGWQCPFPAGPLPAPAEPCVPICGDGLRVEGFEGCDDGNTAVNDGCSAACMVELAYDCVLGPKTAEFRMARDSSSCLAAVREENWYCFGNESGAAAVRETEDTGGKPAGYACLNSSAICAQGVCRSSFGLSEEVCFLRMARAASFTDAFDILARRDELEAVDWLAADLCLTECGDGIRAGAEQCDDGNVDASDGCSPQCLTEPGWYCLRSPGGLADACSSICGDGLKAGAEECDDGAWTQPEGDGCTDVCVQESGFACDHDAVTGRIGMGGCYPAACGDGIWVGAEQCDDGNGANLDGCSSECTVEAGWVCGPGTGDAGSVCEGIHGDGILVSSEQCEDGNAMSGDGCSSSGMIETGYRCPGGVCITWCGDGEIVGRETCDDNNAVDGDGCSKECLIEQGWQCVAAACPADDAGAGGCVAQKGGTGSYCEQCPPTRYGEVRCSHPPCPAAGLTADCKSWRMYEDGGWVHVADGSGGAEAAACRPEWQSDGYCDSINNKGEAGCDWDGGDCCAASCSCGSAGFPCYNGSSGGCGAFRDKQGDYHCIDPATEDVGPPLFHPADTSTPFLSYLTLTLTPAAPNVQMYYTLDGRIPAVELEGMRLVEGVLYTGPFNVTTTTEVRVSSFVWGRRIGQASLPVEIEVRPPLVSPLPVPNSPVSSPVIFTMQSPTTGSSIMYKFASTEAGASLTEFVPYTGPFSVTTSGNLTAKAVKEGATDSQEVLLSYRLATSPVVIDPPGGATVYTSSVAVGLTSETVGAAVYYTLCNESEWPRIANRTGGEIAQVSTDACWPLCTGLCAGGARDGQVCKDENDQSLCGVGICVVSVRLVRECFPSEWLPGATRVAGGPVVLNSTMSGTGTVLTAWASKDGLEEVPVSVTTFRIAAAPPRLGVSHNTSLPIAVPSSATFGPIALPASFYFDVATNGFTVYYRLDGRKPALAEGNNTFAYRAGDPNIALARSANVTAIATADNLLPSPMTWATVDVHQATPYVLIPEAARPVLGARGLLANGLVVGGLEYPITGADTQALWDPAQGRLVVTLTLALAASSLSNIWYRLLPGAPSSSHITYRSGEAWVSTGGWQRFTGEFTIDDDYTLEMIATWPETSNSAIVSVPLSLRTACGVGTTSPDGLQPCTTCPQDSYLPVSCAGQSGSAFFGCQCVACPAGTGTRAAASNASDSCLPICANGTYSSTGLDDALAVNPAPVPACTPCPRGTYEPRDRSTGCVACPSGTTTEAEGENWIWACRGGSGLSAGGFHACGIREDRVAVCWGYNGFGEIEVPRNVLTFLVDGQEVVEDTDYLWKSMSAGSFHTCGVTLEGKGVCWGQDYSGKTAVPTNITQWRSMAASKGYHHSCGVGMDLSGWCWGDDEYGQVSGLPEGMEWEVMSAGQFHSCGVNRSGALLCWGDNSYGQGEVAAEAGPWRTVSAGHYHSCGVLVAGGIACWGSSLYGATAAPADVEAWSMVAVGRLHTCAVTSDGGMRCWGSNQDGATDVPEVAARWTAVTTGLFHSCGVTADGTGHCWGRGVYGVTIVPDVVWQYT